MYILGLLVFAQIVLESLPISSSTHVALLYQFLTAYGFTVPTLSESVFHLMHVPNIIVVCAALSWWYMPTARHWQSREIRRHAWLYAIMLAVSTAITIAFYVWLQGQQFAWTYQYGVFITAALLLATGMQRFEHTPLRMWHSVVIGAMQAVALLPGISRLGSTYAVGRFLGWSPKRSLTYSFFLQLILMGGACVRAVPALWGEAAMLCDTRLLLIVGCAMICSYAALYIVIELAEKHRIWWIGCYLMAVGFLL